MLEALHGGRRSCAFVAFTGCSCASAVSTSRSLANAKTSVCSFSGARRRDGQRRRLSGRPVSMIDAQGVDAASVAMTTLSETSQAGLIAFDGFVGRSLNVTALVFALTSWGLVSFIKGATKARITQASYQLSKAPKDIVQTVVHHFTNRSYKLNPDADPRKGVLTFEGLVSPSGLLATLLWVCAASGMAGVVLVLKEAFPEKLSGSWPWLLGILPSTLVVPWYWKGAERVELVKMLVEEPTAVDADDKGSSNARGLATLWLKGHRDELLEFEASTGWKRAGEDSK